MKKLFVTIMIMFCMVVSSMNVSAEEIGPYYMYTFENPGEGWTDTDFDVNMTWYMVDDSRFGGTHFGEEFIHFTWLTVPEFNFGETDVWLRINMTLPSMDYVMYEYSTENEHDVYLNGDDMTLMGGDPGYGASATIDGGELNPGVNTIAIFLDRNAPLTVGYTAMDLILTGEASAVPIPNAAFLLFTGVGSLLIFRKKII